MKRDESQNDEYKESWHDKYLAWVCGYSNAQGGTPKSRGANMKYLGTLLEIRS